MRAPDRMDTTANTTTRLDNAKGIAAGAVAALIWGGYLTASQYGISKGMTPSDLAFIRFATSGAIMLPIAIRLRTARFDFRSCCRSLLMTTLAGPLFVFMTAGGYRYAPLAHGAVLQLGALTLVSVLLAAFLLRERLSIGGIFGLMLIVAGLYVSARSTGGGSWPSAWVGDVMFVCAGSMWASFTVLQRYWSIRPVEATATVACCSCLVYCPWYVWSVGPGHLQEFDVSLVLGQVVIQGVLSGVIALFAFGYALQKLGAARAGLFPAMAPAAAILIAIPLSGQFPSVLQTAGLLTMTLGLVLSLAYRRVVH